MSCSRTGFSLSGGEFSTGKTKGRQAEACPTGARFLAALMKAILIVGCLFFFALPVRATTYYVAAAGSDSNNGTSTGTPWQTIAHVNAQTFSAGDSILFNKGDAWYGTSLIAPSSGSSGSPITFGAYGSGANPIVKGSTLLNTSGYALDANIGSAAIWSDRKSTRLNSSHLGISYAVF